jgi:predicted dehydrogenase
MERIKIGIIGLGLAWERLHAPAFARLTDKFEIAAVCDTDMDKAQRVAAFLGLPRESAYGDYRDMLTRADIEAVDIMVPIGENYECAFAVIKSGKHLIAEKPLAATLESAKELISLKNQKDIKVLVAENIRYEEENVIIKRLLDEHAIGNPVYFIDNHITEFQKDMLGPGFGQTDWRQHPDFEGGVFLDSGVHHIARQRFLFGEVQSLHATGRPSGVDFAPYSCINALLTFPNNVAGHYAFFLIGKETQAPLVGFRIFGTSGVIYLEERACGFVNVTNKDGGRQTIPYQPGQGYYNELDNFYHALRHGKPIVSTPEKALGDMEVIFAMLKSANKNL